MVATTYQSKLNNRRAVADKFRRISYGNSDNISSQTMEAMETNYASEQKASQGTTDGYQSEASDDDESETSDDDESEATNGYESEATKSRKET
ncbi:hypothetical protein H5410_025804 [Solanum commersonii]|uniref:Uncharacterized protein n=1 Tax=Solanum commersonii TaxID=4109 RepID=A0A9J5YWX5_SOLCO|nr:hypothetical protein H5410_025804 [Solanum commersonii]